LGAPTFELPRRHRLQVHPRQDRSGEWIRCPKCRYDSARSVAYTLHIPVQTLTAETPQTSSRTPLHSVITDRVGRAVKYANSQYLLPGPTLVEHLECSLGCPRPRKLRDAETGRRPSGRGVWQPATGSGHR